MRAVHRRTEALRAAIAEREQPRLLLSDENILGETRPPSLAQGARLYPQADLRLSRLLEALELEQVTLALALRNPLALLVSGWGHQHLAGYPVSFEAYVADVVPEELRWSELVARLLGVKGVQKVLLWRYEDYPALLSEITLILTGVKHGAIDGPRALPLAGPSARALEAVGQMQARRPGVSYKRALRRAMRDYPRGCDWPAPQPFSPEASAEGQARYAHDWACLCKMARVQCLTPLDGASVSPARKPT